MLPLPRTKVIGRTGVSSCYQLIDQLCNAAAARHPAGSIHLWFLCAFYLAVLLSPAADG